MTVTGTLVPVRLDWPIFGGKKSLHGSFIQRVFLLRKLPWSHQARQDFLPMDSGQRLEELHAERAAPSFPSYRFSFSP